MRLRYCVCSPRVEVSKRRNLAVAIIAFVIYFVTNEDSEHVQGSSVELWQGQSEVLSMARDVAEFLARTIDFQNF